MTATDLKEYIFTEKKIEYILEQIGCSHIVYHRNKNYYSCSNYNGDNPTAINIKNSPYLNYINYTRNVSYSDKQDIISLVEYNKKIDFIKALKYLHEILNLPYKNKPVLKPIKKDDPLDIFKKYKSNNVCNVLDIKPVEDIFDDYVPYAHIDIFREGIIKKTIKKFGLGYSYKRKRTVFPIRYWQTGEVMGYNARTSIANANDLGITKYWITPGMNKSINLYGLFENYETVSKKKYITIFEAEKSVLKRDSLFDESCVALQGHYISQEQVRILLGLDVREIVFAMDKDVSIKEIFALCENFYSLRKVSFIYDKWNILNEKDSPADTTSKNYDFLFANRIVYDQKLHKKYLEIQNKFNK